jgi:RAB protein geranylgeranyltransferase component A
MNENTFEVNLNIVRSAAAKNGKSVLQLDPSDQYGGAWASLTLDQFLACLDASRTHRNEQGVVIDSLASISKPTVFRNGSAAYALPAKGFSLDLSPHVIFGVGPMIHLLLDSGAHLYTEYKLIEGTALWDSNTGLTKSIPATRSEIFRDRTMTPLQKRKFMRFMKACMDAIGGNSQVFYGVFFSNRERTTIIQMSPIFLSSGTH